MTRCTLCRSAAAAVAVCLPAATAAGALAATSPAKAKCPSASVVGSTLGLHVNSPVATRTTYATVCTYHGGGVVPTKVQYQEDTAATFAAGEKAAGATGAVVKVKGLGKAAYAVKSGGFLAVFLGNESIRITAPLVPTAKLEKLARNLA
jgi:hypothetical protein